MRENSRWAIDFFLLVIISMIVSGIGYLVQDFLDFSPTLYNLVRLIRMAIVYGFLAIWFTHKKGGNYCSLGLCPPSNIKSTLISVIGGIMVYQVAALVFISNGIFFRGWIQFSLCQTIINLMLIGLMAALTDFWTRGFILLQLSDKFGKKWGILIQNIVWFTIHFYEIQLLQYYIGWLNSILLTLALGILGDMIVLKTRNLYGLMLGHMILNVQIAFVARGYLVINTVLI